MRVPSGVLREGRTPKPILGPSRRRASLIACSPFAYDYNPSVRERHNFATHGLHRYLRAGNPKVSGKTRTFRHEAKTMRWTFVVTFLAAMLVAFTGRPAAAIDLTKSSAEFGPEGTWVTQCDVDRMTDAKTCRMTNYRLFEENKEVGFIALSVIPTGNDYHLFLTTSQGMIQNCGIRVDRQPRIETHIATINMCMFPNFMSGRILDQFRNGASVLVRVNFLRGGRRDIDFALSGFARNFEEMQRALQ